MTFKITMEAARVNAHLTQKEAAKALSVSVSTIQNWENFKTMPDAKLFKQLCELYECPVEHIFVP